MEQLLLSENETSREFGVPFKDAPILAVLRTFRWAAVYQDRAPCLLPTL